MLLIKDPQSSLNIHKSDANWPLFVNKWQFWWSASIDLDHNHMCWYPYMKFSFFTLTNHMPQLA